MIDLYTARFWLAALVAVLLIAPLNRAGARQWAFAFVNLLFITVYLKSHAVFAAAFLVAAYASLKLLERLGPRWAIPLTAFLGASLFTLFMVHKLPNLGVRRLLGPIPEVMRLVGFSYVALRVVDVVRAVSERRRPAPSLPETVNYLMPFHMLAMGPIQAYDDFCDQPKVPAPLGFADSLRAFERIGIGLFKKYVVADFIDQVFLTQLKSRGIYFWLVEMQLNYLYLFLDFSAYSDIAVGLGRLIGFATPENFNRPYFARNMIDYWERWHISLSQFIRRNLFIPIQLALVRKTEGKYPLWIASFAFTASFLLCGVWHNVNLGWLLWGGYNALGLVVCNLYRAYLLKRLGRKGLNAYMANPWIRIAAIFVVYEYVAFSLVVANLSFPWGTR